MAMDVTDQGEFICYLNRVALNVQKPLLEKWGFEASELGVTEMRKAIGDHTQRDEELRKQAEETLAALYWEFYHVCRGATLKPKDRAKPLTKAENSVDGGESSGSDREQAHGDEGWYVAPAHWTGKAQHGWEGWSPEQRGEEPKKASSADRKAAWEALTKAMKGTDPHPLRLAIERAIELKLSTVSINSAKKRLAGIGSGRWLIGLPGEAQDFPEAKPKAKPKVAPVR